MGSKGNCSKMKTKNKRLLGMLGLSRRAGKLVMGTERVCEAIRCGKPNIELVLVACDASDNSRKRIENCCAYYKKPLQPIRVTAAELAHAIGKHGAVTAAGIADSGFTAAVTKIIEGIDLSCKAEDSAGGVDNAV